MKDGIALVACLLCHLSRLAACFDEADGNARALRHMSLVLSGLCLSCSDAHVMCLSGAPRIHSTKADKQCSFLIHTQRIHTYTQIAKDNSACVAEKMEKI